MQVVGGADYAHPRSLDDAPLLANQVVENFEVIPNVSDSNSEKFCGFIIVNGFSYPFVTGRYNMCDEKSSGASEELVYKHELRDSYIFYDPDYGWKLGNQDSLEEHDYWLKSKNKVPNYSHHSIKRTGSIKQPGLIFFKESLLKVPYDRKNEGLNILSYCLY